jgi:flavin reductase (DIM6/NTAB) family NADH-FMN oxidoreductase RutF/DNA-binding IclR family transcriptional regulator
MRPNMDATLFRQVLGQYPTGVVVVTARSETGEALGMTVGSFTSASLDPPLVAFLPDKKSSSWKALRESGDKFCVNILAASQEDVCRAVTMRKQDKLAGVDWHPSAAGNPVITGSVAYIDCTVEDIHDAGDHHIVVGRVQELAVTDASYPLLFFRGGYGSFSPLSLAAGDADLIDQLRLVDLVRAQMERLAQRFKTEVTAITLVRDELVLAASAGHAEIAVAPTRVGQRFPFMPPLGAVFAAWGDEALRARWIENLDDATPAQQVEEYKRVPDRVRERGYAITLGHELVAHLESVATRFRDGDSSVTPETLRQAIKAAAACYNPADIDSQETYELRSMSAPVFQDDGQLALMLTVWGPPGTVTRGELDDYAAGLLDTAAAATEAIHGAT